MIEEGPILVGLGEESHVGHFKGRRSKELVNCEDISLSFSITDVARVGHFVGDFEFVLYLLIGGIDEVVCRHFPAFVVELIHGEQQVED